MNAPGGACLRKLGRPLQELQLPRVVQPTSPRAPRMQRGALLAATKTRSTGKAPTSTVLPIVATATRRLQARLPAASRSVRGTRRSWALSER